MEDGDRQWNDWFRVLGISVLGPEPLGAIHLPWQPGIHVLYGMNGAGKTRLLDSLASLDTNHHQRPVRHLPPTMGDLKAASEFRARHNSYLQMSVNREARVAPERVGPRGGGSHALREAVEEMVSTQLFVPELADAQGDRISIVLDEVRAAGTVGELLDWAIEAHFLQYPYSEIPHEKVKRELLAHPLSLAFRSDGSSWVSSYVDERRPYLAAYMKRVSELQRLTEQQDPLVKVPNPLALMSVVAMYQSWSSEMPMPLFELLPGGLDIVGDLRPISVLNFSDDGRDVNARTNRSAEAWIRPQLEIRDERQVGSVSVPEEAELVLGDLEIRANKLLANFLIQPPHLVLKRNNAISWLTGSPLEWRATDATGAIISLDQLSKAQHRWANAAIRISLTALFEGATIDTTMVVVDEPENALHPEAITHLVRDLEETAKRVGGPVFLATHSPQLLSIPSARLLHVHRDHLGHTIASPLLDEMSTNLSETAARLGFRPADLLQTYGAFLVVEGAHDKEALEALFPGEWAQSRIRIVSMQGGQNAVSVPDSELLMQFTDAAILVVLDHTSRPIIDAWHRAKEIAVGEESEGGRTRALRHLNDTKGDTRSDEERWALESGAAAVANGSAHRFDLLGLTKPDIIQYFDPTFFGLSETWDSLEEQWAATGSDHGRKSWLKRIKKAKINTKRVVEAAQAASDFPHPDLSAVLARAAKLAGGSVLDVGNSS